MVESAFIPALPVADPSIMENIAEVVWKGPWWRNRGMGREPLKLAMLTPI
jgi:hypothetical protein